MRIESGALMVITLSLLSMVTSQGLKFLILAIKNKKMDISTLFTTGGMPSSHTATVVTLVSSLAMSQLSNGGNLDYTFAIAMAVGMVIIHDAMGVRLEAGRHAKVLNNLLVDQPEDIKKQMGFKKSQLKEKLGHKPLEVLGGFIYGLLVGLIGAFFML